jgi:hypothetical protein
MKILKEMRMRMTTGEIRLKVGAFINEGEFNMGENLE